LAVARERLDRVRAELPELPWERRARLAAQYDLPAADARVLTAARELADYYEAAAVELPGNPKGIANWVMTEVLRELKERKAGPEGIRDLGRALPPARLAALVALVDAGRISS